MKPWAREGSSKRETKSITYLVIIYQWKNLTCEVNNTRSTHKLTMSIYIRSAERLTDWKFNQILKNIRRSSLWQKGNADRIQLTAYSAHLQMLQKGSRKQNCTPQTARHLLAVPTLLMKWLWVLQLWIIDQLCLSVNPLWFVKSAGHLSVI